MRKYAPISDFSFYMTKILFHFLLLIYLLPIVTVAQQVERMVLGKVQDSRLNELSGLVASRKYQGLFWTHNDSGDSARFFLIDRDAKLKGSYSLEDIEAQDIEDIATFSQDGKHFLLLADIGDNRAARQQIRLYIVEEPSFVEGVEHYRIARDEVKVLSLTYADKPRDAEAIFVDPKDLTVYLISKRDFHVGVYPFDLVQAISSTEPVVLKKAIELPLTFITAADISADGNYILMKNLTEVYRWQRTGNKGILETLKGEFVKLPYQPEPQGEAICFGNDSDIFYSISERPLGLDAYLYEYRVLKGATLE